MAPVKSDFPPPPPIQDLLIYIARRDYRIEAKGTLVSSWLKPRNWPEFPRTMRVKSQTWKQVGGVEVKAATQVSASFDEQVVAGAVPISMDAVNWENFPIYVPTIAEDKSEGYFTFKQTITVPLPRVIVQLLGSDTAEVGLFLQLKTDPSFADGTYSKPEGINVTVNGFDRAFVKQFGEPRRVGSQWVTDLVFALTTAITAIVPVPHLILSFTVEATGVYAGVDVDYDIVFLAAWFVSAMGFRVTHPYDSEDDGWELLPLQS